LIGRSLALRAAVPAPSWVHISVHEHGIDDRFPQRCASLSEPSGWDRSAALFSQQALVRSSIDAIDLAETDRHRLDR
jgi:hypothetical protein